MLFFWKFFSLSKRHMLPKSHTHKNHTHKLFVFVNHHSLYLFRFQFPYYRCFVFFNDFIFLLVLSVKKNIAISYNLSVDIHMYIPAWSCIIKRPQTLIMLVFFLQFCVNHWFLNEEFELIYVLWFHPNTRYMLM